MIYEIMTLYIHIYISGHNKNDGNEDDAVFRKFAVRTYWTILHQDDVPQALIQIAAWVSDHMASSTSWKIVSF